jgi:hypothetical protein
MRSCKLLAIFALILIVLSGCASLLYRNDVTYETSILKPDGTFIEASVLQYNGDGSSQARQEADAIARRDAVYQTVEYYIEWPFAGYDFEFDKLTLTRGLQSGELKLGKQINNLVYFSSPRTATYNARGTTVTGGGGYWSRVDSSKPDTYSPVYIKTIKERTVDAFDETKYKQIFDKNYKPLYERYHKEYIEKRKRAFAYIDKKLKGDFVELSDDMPLTTATGRKLNGKVLKSIFLKHLNKLEPGCILVNGSAYDDMVITAYMENGSLICKWTK